MCVCVAEGALGGWWACVREQGSHPSVLSRRQVWDKTHREWDLEADGCVNADYSNKLSSDIIPDLCDTPVTAEC